MLVSKPPKGGTPLTAAGALGVGRREAFGVRQLAAALFSCPNNVSVPISAFGGSSADFGNRRLEQGTICSPRYDPGGTHKQRACPFI
ncbi:MAG: hypothetical protein GX456_19355 [Verrucomicrobia bacterium]|nr:hypothetical protein [Verrucomicrobiota bacterium]